MDEHTSLNERQYRKSKTFCLGFPTYKKGLFADVERVILAVRAGALPYRGSQRGTRNQVLKDLVVCGLAINGNDQAIERQETRGFVCTLPSQSQEGCDE